MYKCYNKNCAFKQAIPFAFIINKNMVPERNYKYIRHYAYQGNSDTFHIHSVIMTELLSTSNIRTLCDSRNC